MHTLTTEHAIFSRRRGSLDTNAGCEPIRQRNLELTQKSVGGQQVAGPATKSKTDLVLKLLRSKKGATVRANLRCNGLAGAFGARLLVWHGAQEVGTTTGIPDVGKDGERHYRIGPAVRGFDVRKGPGAWSSLLLDVEADVRALCPSLDGAASPRQRWLDLVGTTAPSVSPKLLRLAVAWQIQAVAFGGLSPLVRRRLVQAHAAKSRTSRVGAGTRLVREWQGTTHVVLIDCKGVVRCERIASGVHSAPCSRHHRHALVRACLLRAEEKVSRGMNKVRCAIYTRKSSDEGSGAELQLARCSA